jgi:hypothetical protein
MLRPSYSQKSAAPWVQVDEDEGLGKPEGSRPYGAGWLAAVCFALVFFAGVKFGKVQTSDHKIAGGPVSAVRVPALTTSQASALPLTQDKAVVPVLAPPTLAADVLRPHHPPHLRGGEALQGIVREEDAACEYKLRDVVASRPGVPCIPPAKVYPWVTRTQWRIDLGERIRAAAAGRVTEEQCGGWMLYGDAAWCMNVMTARQKGNTDILAFSYGIEERDEWSEKMGSVFKVPSYLYDCFIEPEKSPPMAKTAPNGTVCQKDQAHCYEMPYWSYRTCLGHEAGNIDGRSYETLASHLKNRGPLSTHLKIDVEGSEWTVLEDLLKSEEDLGKVRSLDMEVHFGFNSASEAKFRLLPEDQRLERQVKIFEQLAEKLVVTGTTFETYRQGWWPEKDCPEQQCHEPVVHLRGGWSPQMFAISYINRALLDAGNAGETPAIAHAPMAKTSYNPSQLPEEALQARTSDDNAEEPPCEYEMKNVVASRPGVPCIPPAEVYPYQTRTKWRIDLGERIRKAAAGRVTEEQCGGWMLYGDAAWCMKVMTARQKGNAGILAFSYGIEERDEWSEKMGSVFKVPSQLYDCFIPPENSPPIAKTAPNGTACKDQQPHCYEMPYWSYRTCLGHQSGTIDGRSYETLASHLKNRGPLSTHLKIDVEGSEWTVLEDLLKSDEDLAKVRSLDMEVHFGFNSASEKEFRHLPEVERLERQVRIFEELAEKLIVTGTTIETYRQGWFPKQDCPEQQCHEPVVHLRGGWSPQMFAISYINRALLDAA